MARRQRAMGKLRARPAETGTDRRSGVVFGRPQMVAHLPELLEETPAGRAAQVADAFAAAGARLCADHALGHGDVTVTPRAEQLVVVEECLGEEVEVAVVTRVL